MDRTVTCAAATPPSWEVVRALLGHHDYGVTLRMINGELAFPDEVPPADWQELRVGTPAGMVTVRWQPGALSLVVWGNADADLVRAWNALTWAFAEAGGGQVETPAGSLAPAVFRTSAELPTGWPTALP